MNPELGRDFVGIWLAGQLVFGENAGLDWDEFGIFEPGFPAVPVLVEADERSYFSGGENDSPQGGALDGGKDEDGLVLVDLLVSDRCVGFYYFHGLVFSSSGLVAWPDGLIRPAFRVMRREGSGPRSTHAWKHLEKWSVFGSSMVQENQRTRKKKVQMAVMTPAAILLEMGSLQSVRARKVEREDAIRAAVEPIQKM